MPDGTSNKKRPATKAQAAKQKRAERTAAIIAKHRAAFVRAVTARNNGTTFPYSSAEIDRYAEFAWDMTRAAVYAALPGKQSTLSGDKALAAAVKATCAVIRKRS